MRAESPGTPAWGWEGHLTSRLLVVLLALVWGVLASPVPVSLDGWGTAVVAVGLFLFIVLGHRTMWLATPFGRAGDQRTMDLRGLAYRRAFRLFSLGVLLLIPMLVVGAGQGGTTIDWGVPSPLGARAIVAAILMLVALPTAVVAWLAPPGGGRTGSPATGVPVGALTGAFSILLSACAVAWLVGFQSLPVAVASKVTIPDPQDDFSGATCGAFAAVSQLDQGVGPSLVMLAQVCWDTKAVWMVNDPGGPSPFRYAAGLSNALPQFCQRSTDRSDFGVLADQQCRVWVDRAGTIHVAMQAEAESGLPGLGSRRLRLELVVTKDGRVVTFD